LFVPYQYSGQLAVGAVGTSYNVPVGTYYVYVANDSDGEQAAKQNVAITSGSTTVLTFDGSETLK
jgi:hypothetical protein